MPVPTLITDLSTTAASNYPSGTDTPAILDDVQRAHASFIAELRDGRLPLDGSLAMTGALQANAGIKFPAVQVPSANANTLDDYEEGTFTPVDTSGAGLVFSNNTGTYTRIGRLVTIFGSVNFPITANGLNTSIGGLPFPGVAAVDQPGASWIQGAAFTALGFISGASSSILLFNTFTASFVTNSTASGLRVRFSFSYITS